MKTFMGLLIVVMVALFGCGDPLNIDGGLITGNGNPPVISNLTPPTGIVITANTGTVAIPIGAELHGVRGETTLWIDLFDNNYGLMLHHSEKLLNPLGGGIDINYTAEVVLNTAAFTPGQGGHVSVYMVVSDPTTTSNEQSVTWAVH